MYGKTILNYEIINLDYWSALPFASLDDPVDRVRTGPGNPGKSWNFIIAFSRTGKSWKSNAGPGKSWKSVKLNKVIKFSLKQMSKVFLVFL